MDPSPTERGDFIPYPTNRVVGTIADSAEAHAAVEALLQAGLGREDIDVLHGDADIGRLDPTGEEHGVLAQVQRTLIRNAAANEEYRHLKRHVEDLRAGRFVIMVLVRRREQRVAVADLLNAHGAEFVGFYGRWAWEGFPADTQASAGTDAATEGLERQRPTTSRGLIASLFVDAWNARNPDALAALFEHDAELVTAAGSWAHDRASIRQVFADQFARLDRSSTLRVDETRVKQVHQDVAVVFTRMILSGAPPDRSGQPEPRTNICSFVTRRAGEGWVCAAAHNIM